MILVRSAHALLRSRRPEHTLRAIPAVHVLALLLLSAFGYGVVMGLFGLRPVQALYSGLKTPILLTASTVVCLPNLFVLNTLLGLRDDFGTVLRGLVNAQLTLALALASFAPFTALAYASSSDYTFAVFWNGLMFLAASLIAHARLGRTYEHLIAKNRQHLLVKRAWLALHVFVTIQLAWMLRPFIGDPRIEVRFFREGIWDNAYVVVWNDVCAVFGS